jgi:hypothetical protein
MASELELRRFPALPRGTARATPGRLPLAPKQPHSPAIDPQRPDARPLAGAAAGTGLDSWIRAETTSAGAA